MTATRPNARPLTVTLRLPWAERVRDVAQGQGVTYLSLVEACVQSGLAAGGPTMLEPFGLTEDTTKRHADGGAGKYEKEGEPRR